MVGKPYAEYHDTFEHVKDSLLWGDSQGRRAAVRMFEEAAAADATGEWDLICRIIKCDARFYESRNGGFIASVDYTAEDFAGDLLALANEADVKGFPLMRILSLWYVAQTYRLFIHDADEYQPHLHLTGCKPLHTCRFQRLYQRIAHQGSRAPDVGRQIEKFNDGRNCPRSRFQQTLHILQRLQKSHRIFTDGLSWQLRFSVMVELYFLAGKGIYNFQSLNVFEIIHVMRYKRKVINHCRSGNNSIGQFYFLAFSDLNGLLFNLFG